MDIALVFGGCHRRGGVERSVWELASHLSSRHSVSVYARDLDREGLNSVRCVALDVGGPPWLSTPMFARAARAALSSQYHDHIVSFGVGDVGADILWVNSVHRAWLRQGLNFRADRGPLRSPLLRYLLPRHQLLLAMEWVYFKTGRRAAVVTVADAVGEDLHRLYGIAPDLVTTIHNGYAPDEFSPARRRILRPTVRAQFGYRDGDFVVLMAANELVRKGFDVLVEAAALVGDPRVQVLLVGRHPLTAAHEKRLADLAMTGRVRYAGSQDDMGRMHAVADVLALPTQYEAFALTIVEALASGLPVITTTVPGAGDRITDGVNGLLLRDPQSPAELAGLLRHAMDPARLSQLAEQAPGSVADLTWENLAGTFEQLLTSLPLRRDGVRRP